MSVVKNKATCVVAGSNKHSVPQSEDVHQVFHKSISVRECSLLWYIDHVWPHHFQVQGLQLFGKKKTPSRRRTRTSADTHTTASSSSQHEENDCVVVVVVEEAGATVATAHDVDARHVATAHDHAPTRRPHAPTPSLSGPQRQSTPLLEALLRTRCVNGLLDCLLGCPSFENEQARRTAEVGLFVGLCPSFENEQAHGGRVSYNIRTQQVSITPRARPFT